jgi:hypothetical protein
VNRESGAYHGSSNSKKNIYEINCFSALYLREMRGEKKRNHEDYNAYLLLTALDIIILNGMSVSRRRRRS